MYCACGLHDRVCIWEKGRDTTETSVTLKLVLMYEVFFKSHGGILEITLGGSYTGGSPLLDLSNSPRTVIEGSTIQRGVNEVSDQVT